jgi:hypothetical protein
MCTLNEYEIFYMVKHSKWSCMCEIITGKSQMKSSMHFAKTNFVLFCLDKAHTFEDRISDRFALLWIRLNPFIIQFSFAYIIVESKNIRSVNITQPTLVNNIQLIISQIHEYEWSVHEQRNE